MKTRLDAKRKNLHYNAIYLLSLCICLLMAGCVNAPPLDASEEIKRYEWVRTDENGAKNETSGHLAFSGSSLSLTSSYGESRLDLNGECIVENDTITVITDDFGSVVMEYELSSEKLTLKYAGKTAKFVKK